MGREIMSTPLKVKRGMAMGAFLLIILGMPNAARSDTPLLVFAETIVFALVLAVPLVGAGLVISRLRDRRSGG